MSFFVLAWLACIALAVAVLLAAARWRSFTLLGSELAGGLLLAGFPLIFAAPLGLWATIAAVLTHMWLLVLPARLYMGRLEPLFLLRSTGQNAVAALVVAILLVAVASLHVATSLWLLAVVVWLVVALGVGLFFLGQSLWTLRRYRLRRTNLPMGSLPTVSVCIPARNEDHALADCLESVLASDYPKLEVLVLDDCSQDTTSTVIRSFAHDGVRFVQGDQPALGWLGRTQAMQTLAEQATGDYLLFIDVDTHVAPDSVSQTVLYALEHKLDMVSVAPQNRLGVSASTLFGTLEYFWRIVLPLTNRRMPVSSRYWLAKRASLEGLGGFASVSRMVVPEESFARRLFNTGTYRFLVSGRQLGVTVAKRWSSQVATSVRLAYPLLKRQPLAALAACTLLGLVLLAPYGVAAFELWRGHAGVVFWLALAASLVFLLDYYLVLVRTLPRAWWLAGLLWPVVVAQEIVMCVASMLLYEFGEVTWKGRNVCYPVLALQPGRPVWRR